MPIRNEIIYPFFFECCEFAPNNFWKNIFDDLAYGKTPYGTYINKDFLCCSYKGKEFIYKIERKDPRVIYNDIYKLLKHKMGVLSNNEKINKRNNFYETESKIKENRLEWSNIRKKNIKDLLLEIYIINMKNKYNLSVKQARNLNSIVFIGLTFKIITPKDIIYEDFKIKEIKGIEFENKKIILKINLYKNKLGISNDIENKKTYMSDNWDKYLSAIKEC